MSKYWQGKNRDELTGFVAGRAWMHVEPGRGAGGVVSELSGSTKQPTGGRQRKATAGLTSQVGPGLGRPRPLCFLKQAKQTRRKKKKFGDLPSLGLHSGPLMGF